jgi:hypothetical protein
MAGKVHVFGIRHHGPGSARSLGVALDALDPDVVLIEGPPDAQEIITLAAREEMKPPVAILVYAADEPQRAVFYPFASYSPEWQAIRFAVARQREVRFIDLPQWHRLALSAEEEAAAAAQPGAPSEESHEPEEDGQAQGEVDIAPDPEAELRSDPMGYLARLAGYPDGERWWDHLVETRRDGTSLFAEVRDAMAALREQHDPPEIEKQREAYMAQSIRAAQKEGFERIAVVCGAWHAPVLADLKSASADAAMLKGLPKVKTRAAWVPWSYDRLSYRSGYGAGVESPEWYHLLWEQPTQPVTHWMSRMARLLRSKDLPASSAHVIEAVRLAETLAALRDRALPGLSEMLEATRAVVCNGETAPIELIERELVYGHRLGEVPEDLPMAPLQEDLAREQKRLRLKASGEEKDFDFDLRTPTDLERSHLLHRLRVIGVPWGVAQTHGGPRSKGTFHELWRLQWKPEFAVSLIEASLWGGTVAEAAGNRAVALALEAQRIEAIAAVLNDALLAGLDTAVEKILGVLSQRAAVSRDVLQLLDAFPGLARARRYGSVRQTDGDVLDHVLQELGARICVGLGPACASLDDDAAALVRDKLILVDGAMGLRESEAETSAWQQALTALADQAGLHPLVAGRVARMLHDARVAEAEDTARRMGLALSSASGALPAAQWIEGFVAGSGTMLVHDDTLFALLDEWIGQLAADHFTETLPLLRRTFSTFQLGERRQIGERAKAGGAAAPAVRHEGFDAERAAKVMPVLRQIFATEKTP